MDELWVRAAIVGAGFVAAALVSYRLSSRGRRRPRSVDTGDMAPGIYLFTSSTCADCAPARRKLAEKLGRHGYTEVSWEEQPGVLQDLGIDAVPATLIVGDEGDGTLYPGQPDRALARLGP